MPPGAPPGRPALTSSPAGTLRLLLNTQTWQVGSHFMLLHMLFLRPQMLFPTSFLARFLTSFRCFLSQASPPQRGSHRILLSNSFLRLSSAPPPQPPPSIPGPCCICLYNSDHYVKARRIYICSPSPGGDFVSFAAASLAL